MPSVTISAPAVSVGVAAPRVTAGPTQPSPFPGSGFVFPTVPKRQACILVYADGGNGKSTLGAVYAPAPVGFINFDGRAEYAITKAAEAGRQVYPSYFTVPIGLSRMSTGEVQKACTEILRGVLRDIEIGAQESKAGRIRTLVLDTGTELSELMSLAARGTVDAAKGDYGKSKDWINKQWWTIFNTVRASSAHLIVLARAQAVWEGNEPTGDFKARIPDVVRDAVDWAGHLKIGRKRAPLAMGVPAAPGIAAPAAVVAAPAPAVVVVGGGAMPRAASALDPTAPREFQMQITKAGNNFAELGRVYGEDDWGTDGPFVYCCTKLMPGSTSDDWR